MEGTSTLSADDFNEKVDFMGSSISIGPSRDFALATFTSLKKYQGDTLHLLAQILQQPGLRDADIQRKQAEQIAEIKSSEEEPGYTASVAFSQHDLWRYALRPSRGGHFRGGSQAEA